MAFGGCGAHQQAKADGDNNNDPGKDVCVVRPFSGHHGHEEPAGKRAVPNHQKPQRHRRRLASPNRRRFGGGRIGLATGMTFDRGRALLRLLGAAWRARRGGFGVKW